MNVEEKFCFSEGRDSEQEMILQVLVFSSAVLTCFLS